MEDLPPEPDLTQQVQHLQQQLAAAQQHNQRLQQQVTRQQHDILRLSHWLQGLQRDIQDVYHSVTWLIGYRVTRFILAVLRRPEGPTARDHVERVQENFKHWQQRFFAEAETPLEFPWHDAQEYARWLTQQHAVLERQLAALPDCLTEGKTPTFTLLMVVDDCQPVRSDWLQQAIASVQQQTYAQWQLWILLPETAASGVAELSQLPHSDARIHLHLSKAHGTVASALNHALYEGGSGEFCAIIGGYDALPPYALLMLAAHLHTTAPQPDVLYSDSDELTASGQRCAPHFKPDWNPDLFCSQCYLNNLTVVRTALLKAIMGFAAEYPGYEMYDALWRLLETEPKLVIDHVPQVLYHHRQGFTPHPTAACDALSAHFQRTQPAVEVSLAVNHTLRVHYPLPITPPLVSIIIPTRDRLELLRDTVEGVLQQTDYPNVQLIILDNDSVESATLAYLKHLQQDTRVAVLKDKRPFNYSRLNNLGVSVATGEVIALLNNDLAIIHPDWLREMVSHALRPDIGAVGAKLYYPDDSVQHAGVIVGLGGMAGHAFKHLPKQFAGYQWRPFVTQNYSAVTGACLVMRRSVFMEVGGLNAEDLAVAFNDVDLCLKLGEAGYRVVWTPYAELYHRESASRGADTSPRKFFRLQRELRYMRQRWGTVIAHDPYYNPNLTVQYEDFSLHWGAAVKK